MKNKLLIAINILFSIWVFLTGTAMLADSNLSEFYRGLLPFGVSAALFIIGGAIVIAAVIALVKGIKGSLWVSTGGFALLTVVYLLSGGGVAIIFVLLALGNLWGALKQR